MSTTRTGNFEPPRIVVGTPHETTTVLTKQDWRDVSGPGWGTSGAWRLHVPHETSFEVTLVFGEERRVDSVSLRVGEELRELEVGAAGRSIPIGVQVLPAGDVDLSVACLEGSARAAPHQVVLRVVPGNR